VNWDAIGAIAELGGALGVIATLVYLAKQIRRSSAAENANAYQSLMDSWHQATARLLDPDTRATFVKGLGHYDSLSENERLQFHVQVAQLLDRFETMLHFKLLGVTDKVHPAEQFTPLIKDLMSNAGFKRFWASEHSYFSPTMRAWMQTHCPDAGQLDESGYLSRVVRGGNDAA
jgi:hypothetical protein